MVENNYVTIVSVKYVRIIVVILICMFAGESRGAVDDLTLLKAAQRGDVPSMRKIGMRMYRGVCFRGDPSTGIQWLKKAADNGDADAMYYLGSIYASRKNEAKAAEYLRSAADKGHHKAEEKLEKLPLRYSLEVIEEKARSGDYKACMKLLGAYVVGGKGLEIDDEQAWEWFEHARRLDEKNTMETLRSWKVSQTAPIWERLARESNNEEAVMKMAELYDKGADGVPCDAKKALEYYKQAASSDNPKAISWLREKGIAFETKIEKTQRIAREAAEKEMKRFITPEAKNDLFDGVLAYVHGDRARAEEKLRKAADAGSADAQAFLAEILFKEEKKYEEAGELYNLAAQKDHPIALYHLAYCKLIGEDNLRSRSLRSQGVAKLRKKINEGGLSESIPENVSEGFKLLERSMRNGCKNAGDGLILYSLGLPKYFDQMMLWADYCEKKYDSYMVALTMNYAPAQLSGVGKYIVNRANRGNAAAWRYIAVYDLVCRKKKDEVNLKMFKRAIEGGDIPSLYWVATEYEEDDKEKRKILGVAADRGDRKSIETLAAWYHAGQNGPKDIQECIKLYERAIELGSPSAMARLGRIYAKGDGVPKDTEKARNLLIYAVITWSIECGSFDNILDPLLEGDIKSFIPYDKE